ncbi:type I restriction enzyme M protein [Stackebrandtia albiflava]|uniref:site-specific DNA-methyltransferase (adenine-specific) n=1 Tax=Stackebrandtia albiflava TaxID=406432 RepID=A0A562UL83_9ACTN|nr:class I SAM-dependent DNA methyltransferase [Stackebrandtia albiflava]TWJ06374.1 type I restriction enzyme M protein [Stackebrandtia albiflava]
MSSDTRSLVAKLWNYCDVLRDDGVSTIDYVEQLTYLLFLKMAHERAERVINADESLRPVADRWQQLLDADAQELENVYRDTLAELGREPGTIGVIFRKAQNKIQDPAKLKRLIVDLIGKQSWSRQGTDVKGDAYEELLAKSAEDIKSGAGQYFTPRSLIAAIVDCVRPGPDDTIADPACGTGGFLLEAHEYIARHHDDLTADQREHLNTTAIHGTELVDGTARLAAMNMLVHGIGKPNGATLIDVKDALAEPPTRYASIVLANPPFGKKSSITVIGEDGKADRESISYNRNDFWTTTTNKQLNFVQHIASMLDIQGRAAVVVPDNVLFEGGAGEKVRRQLLSQFDVHTLLRLPTGIFYAGGVKANVLFFDKRQARPGKPWTETLWVYDFRVGQHFTLKQNPLRREHLQDFVDCFRADDRSKRVESDRFKPFGYDELVARDKANLDITWLKDPSLDDADSLLPPEVIAQEIVEDLEAAISEFAAIAQALQKAKADRGEMSPAEE